MGYLNHTCTEPSSQDIIIDEPTAFTIDISGDIPFCERDSVLLSVSSADFSSAIWSTGESGLSIYAKEAGTFSVDATSTSGCVSLGSTILTTLTAPSILITAEAETVGLGQSTQLEASGADTYIWTPGEGLDDPSISNPIASPQATTVYQVAGTDLDGCKGEAEIIINVEDTGEALPVDAPKMFSPNSDGIDDLWVIGNIQSFPDCELVVFSRYGSTVFERKGYNNDWDGTDQAGVILPEGAYFYTISCEDGKNTSGSVSVIR